MSETSNNPTPVEKKRSDINWVVLRSKDENGYEIVDMVQNAFLEMLNKDTNNCLHNCYLMYLDKTYIPNCIYRCTNCLTKNSLLNERLIRDVVKVYTNNKFITGNEREDEILENYHAIRTIFMRYEEERRKRFFSPKKQGEDKSRIQSLTAEGEKSGEQDSEQSGTKTGSAERKKIINIEEILHKRKIVNTSKRVVDKIIQQDTIKRKKKDNILELNVSTVKKEDERKMSLDIYKQEFRKLMTNKFMSKYVIALKTAINN